MCFAALYKVKREYKYRIGAYFVSKSQENFIVLFFYNNINDVLAKFDDLVIPEGLFHMNLLLEVFFLTLFHYLLLTNH